jgi:hypothetical protein
MKDEESLSLYRELRAAPEAVEPATWVALARRELGSRYNDCAILVLCDAGDERGLAAAKELVAESTYQDEPSWEGLEIAWRLRHELPLETVGWFGPGVAHEPADEALLAFLGNPVARRRVACRAEQVAAEAEVDDFFLSPLELGCLMPKSRAALRQRLLAWTRNQHVFSPLDEVSLRYALEMGWKEIAASLEENPYLLPGLLTIDRRPDCYDEPGLLMSHSAIVAWSALAPSELLAKIVAWGVTTDLVALAKEAAVRAGGNQAAVAAAEPLYQSMIRDLRPALAIAWKRCRHLVEATS